jgi:hypothetical protein
MRMSKSTLSRIAAGTDLASAVMIGIQLVGMAVAAVLLKRFTPLPFWACFVLALPLCLLVFWGFLCLFFGRGGRRRR